MPSPIEVRISELCARAAAATNREDADLILAELRLAIKEHLEQAKARLRPVADAIKLLESEQ